MNLFKTQKQNLESIANDLLKHLRVKVTPITVGSCILNHPEYPSILSLSDCLDNWNVKNDAYRIDKTAFEKEDLLFPFAAHFTEKGGRFILVHNIEEGSVHYTDEKERKGIMTEQEFLDRWDGIAFHAEGKTTSGEKDYRLNYLKAILHKLLLPSTMILCMVILGFSIAAHPFSLFYTLLCSLKFIGTGISILLLAQSINSQNPFIRNLCGLAGKSDCNSILKSDAAKITDWLSWSEIGFFYYTGSLLLLLIQPSSVSLIAWLNVTALPYTIYSITYQYRHKNWCILCCAVQVILWSEFLANAGHSTFSFPVVTDRPYWILICFLAPVIIWALLKPAFYQAQQLAPLQRQLKKFKYNTDLFLQALTNQPRYAVGADLMPVVLGNPDASTVITMVSNPNCNPCARAHSFLETWIAGRDDIQVKVVFATADHDNDIRTKVARHLAALTLSNEKKIAERALTHWYEQKGNFEAWAEAFPLDKAIPTNDSSERQKQWCKMAEITFTPTILINGYKMPDPYQLEDLRYLLN